MRFIPDERIRELSLAPQELLFLDCWYSFTHMRSLDSHRVKCLNARTILKELCDEISIGRLEAPEFADICKETLALLEIDRVVTELAPKTLAALKQNLLSSPTLAESTKKDKEQAKNLQQLRDLRFVCGDLAALLDERYFATLCERLQSAIENQTHDEIEAFTNSILSDLVSRGWTLETLFNWHRHFIMQPQHGFKSNLAFMLKQLSRPRQQFEVTLRINGGSRLGQISKFGPFKISAESELIPSNDAEKRFAASDSFTVFAKGLFTAADILSAALVARDAFEPILDVLRFEYEPRMLRVDDQTHVRRIGDSYTKLTQVTNPVPNPVESFDEQDFNAFSEKLSEALNFSSIDSESKSRIETAFRRYRFGRDSHNYADKFLNWWMGLEALCNVGGERIGRTVTRNASYAMLTGYLSRILRDFLITIKYLKVPWKSHYGTKTCTASFSDIGVGDLIRIIRDDKCRDLLWDAIKARPLIITRANRINEWLRDPAFANKQLSGHLQRLQWHIDRLYRIRCCIVHGSPIRFQLALFSANLEYYLKQTLIFTLDAIHSHRHVTELSGLFQRNIVMWDRRFTALNDSSANSSTIDDAVFAGVVMRD